MLWDTNYTFSTFTYKDENSPRSVTCSSIYDYAHVTRQYVRQIKLYTGLEENRIGLKMFGSFFIPLYHSLTGVFSMLITLYALLTHVYTHVGLVRNDGHRILLRSGVLLFFIHFHNSDLETCMRLMYIL